MSINVRAYLAVQPGFVYLHKQLGTLGCAGLRNRTACGKKPILVGVQGKNTIRVLWLRHPCALRQAR